MQLGRRDQAQEGSQAGWLWGFLCGKHWHQEPSPDSQQETLPCLVTEDIPASPGQEVEDPCSSTTSSAHSPWDSSSSWESGSSEADGCCCFVPGAPRDSLEEVEKGLGMAKEETALQVLMEQLQGREQPHSWWVQDEARQLRFLHTITPFVHRCTAERAGHAGAALVQSSCGGEDCAGGHHSQGDAPAPCHPIPSHVPEPLQERCLIACL
ncbi:uncharacterized protein LOC114021582 [Chelonia mydas]|uniref:uncharacterized protein LOC114021582 n=1 Tax=Chelonia mydas TaxID=8469 RepID=UPI001CA7DE66|nr:uncharacterized protein LOC114021582 [Chelonia mydas]